MLLRAERQYTAELAAAVEAALAAGAIVHDLYERAAATTYAKGDGSPVTDADLAADRTIRETLGNRFPDIPILSEESEDDAERCVHDRCWIVDPIDGTEQFILRTGEFDILIALVEDGRPTVAVGYQPPTRTLITATVGGGAWARRGDDEPQRIVFQPASDPMRLATSKWFGAPENAAIIEAVARRIGAELRPPGVTGFSPRMFLPPRPIDAMVGVRPGADQTMASEWDFAVADLVFHEAGGVVSDLEGGRHRYNKVTPRNAGGLVAAADPHTHERVVGALSAVLRES
jgi:3'-phosphoadenosine 5'-phosphosulfate (PAPS) 3'-phosphatase